ncbi:IS91 family transposase, partial [bacterium CPR1]|nr:IS91 family transposase [bacterium CPR1]
SLRRIAADPRHLGAEIGYLAVLHTWGQNLSHHPHVHCVVPGGGLSPNGERWVSARKGFFLPVRVLSRLFRGLFLDAVRKAFEAGRMSFSGSLAHLSDPQAFSVWLESHWRADWVVYCKRPFAGPAQVLEYLGRYTHRVAISNHRLVNVSDTEVAFRWKDYRHHDKQRTMRLHPHEFMRRFLQHGLCPSSPRRLPGQSPSPGQAGQVSRIASGARNCGLSRR